MQSGIYKILNKINGKFYIGSAKNFKKRWWVHCSLLRNNKHHNEHLQAAWNKYGELAFEFIILHECKIEELLICEQSLLDQTKCFNRDIGYNTCTVAGNSIGYRHSEEFKVWQSNRVSGNKHSEETKLKMSNSAKKPKTKEHSANIAKGKLGNRFKVAIVQHPLIKKENGSWG